MDSENRDESVPSQERVAQAKKLARKYEKLVQAQPDYIATMQELRGYTVNLSKDPSSLPLSEVSHQIERIQSYRDRTVVAKTEAVAAHHLWKSLESDVGEEVEHHVNMAMLNRPEVHSQSNQTLRLAAANQLVPGTLRKLRRLVRQGVAHATLYDRQVGLILDNLDQAFQSVSRQITVVQMQADLGEISRGETGGIHIKRSMRA